jgi:hypothetical protein
MRNPFKKSDVQKPFDYFREQQAVVEEYGELLNKAGIAEEVRRCEEMLEPHISEDQDLPPLFTRARATVTKQRETGRAGVYRFGLRQIIFRVPDLELRKALIRCVRKLRDLKLESFRRDLWDAQRRRNQVGRTSTISIAFAGLGGGIAVLIGWNLGGAMWGTATGIGAVIMAMHGVADQERTNRRAVQGVEEEIADLEKTIEEIYEGEVFDSSEEHTGYSSEELAKQIWSTPA